MYVSVFAMCDGGLPVYVSVFAVCDGELLVYVIVFAVCAVGCWCMST